MKTTNIEIEHTNIPAGVRELAERLPDKSALKPGGAISLVFDRRNFVYLTGLVMLATWRKSLGEGITCQVDDSHCEMGTRALITNSGFREIIETGHESPSVQKRLGRLPLCPITNRFNKDATVQEVTSLFDEYAGHVSDTKPFATMLSELCENVLAHSEAVSPGYVGARVIESPQSRKVEIAICDTGVGFRGSYMNGTNESAKSRIQKGASPIVIALDGLNSSKPVPVRGSYLSYYGFGLFIVRRLVEENRGQMSILSGNELVSLDHFGKRQQALASQYPGTFIGIVLDLDNPLPLEEIYEQASNALVGPSSPTKETKTPVVAVAPLTSVDAPTSEQGDSPTTHGLLELKHFGTELLTREAGLAIRADLATRLLLSEKVVVILDGISDITPSVADEAFAKLAQRVGLSKFDELVIFQGGTPLVRRLIEFVVKTRTR